MGQDYWDLWRKIDPPSNLPPGSGFIHAAAILDIANGTVTDFGNGVVIRKAGEVERTALTTLLHHFVARRRHSDFPVVYEAQFDHRDRLEADQEKWRYHVIAYDNQDAAYDFIRSSTLSVRRIRCGPEVLRGGGGADGGDQFRILLEDGGDPLETFDTLSTRQCDDLADVWKKYQAFNSQKSPLKKAVLRYMQLDALAATSPWRVIGYVSLIEIFTTRDFNDAKQEKGITHQVSRKMALIGQNSILPIPYYSLDYNGNPIEAWEQVYKYRSCIAHGEEPDFTHKKLSMLKDAKTALAFVQQAARALLREALESVSKPFEGHCDEGGVNKADVHEGIKGPADSQASVAV